MLHADAWQRYLAAANVIRANWPPATTLLDVGGGSGGFVTFLEDYSIWVADPIIQIGTPGVQSLGSELPFGDRSIDVVVSLDTLEHIPPENRAAFLYELKRVARKAVLISAPFESPGIEFAERRMCEYYAQYLNQEHPWLHEHIAHQRPVLSEVETVFSSHAMAVAPLGNLSLWTRMQLLDVYLSVIPHGAELAQRIDTAYREIMADGDCLSPCYRQFVFVRFDGNPAVIPQPLTDREALERLLAFECELSSILQIAPMPPRTTTDDSQLVESYQRAIHQWEAAYHDTLRLAEKGHRWRENLLARRSIRWLRRVLHWVGKDL